MFKIQYVSELSCMELGRDGNRFGMGLRQNLFLSCFMMLRPSPVLSSIQLSSETYCSYPKLNWSNFNQINEYISMNKQL